jgi:SAM-dependent methyltransferase
MEPTPTSDKSQWKQALEGEVDFWRRVVAEKGWRWPEDYQRRLDPNLPLEPAVAEFLPPSPTELEILDVGAGPLTRLGKKHPGRVLRITAIDALAADYDRILAEQGITPLVRTLPGDAAALLDQFVPNRFDLVYCRNAMDHGYDPLGGIRNSLAVLKPGCFLTLFHFTNEGVYQQYEGLHQWNFDVQNGRFTIWNQATRIDAAEALGSTATDISCEMLNQRLLRVAIRKS